MSDKQRFEYKQDGYSGSKSPRLINDAINKVANDGWRLIYIQFFDSAGAGFWQAVYERPIELSEENDGDE